MSSLIQEIIRDALDSSVRLSDLLRKVYAAATKLDLKDTCAWVKWELDGYPSGGTFPDYRRIRGVLKVENPEIGLIPLLMDDRIWAEKLEWRSASQPVAEIEVLLRSNSKGGVIMRFPPDVEKKLMDGQSEDPMRPVVEFDKAPFQGILDGVRNRVLEWALEMEKNGILGEGMSFSEDERRAATTVSIGSIHTGDNSPVLLAGRDATSVQGLTGAELLKVIREVLGDSEPKVKEAITVLEQSVNEPESVSRPNVAAALESCAKAKPGVKDRLKTLFAGAAGSGTWHVILQAAHYLWG